jgi:hypothetical protein
MLRRSLQSEIQQKEYPVSNKPIIITPPSDVENKNAITRYAIQLAAISAKQYRYKGL